MIKSALSFELIPNPAKSHKGDDKEITLPAHPVGRIQQADLIPSPPVSSEIEFDTLSGSQSVIGADSGSSS